MELVRRRLVAERAQDAPVWWSARAVEGLVVCLVIAGVGFAEGGLSPRTWRLTAVALLGLAAAALVARARIVVGRSGWVMLAALSGLVAWTALSTIWSSHPTASLLQAERVLVYAAGVLAALLGARRASVRSLLIGALAGVTLLATYGLTRYIVSPPPLDRFEGRLLYQPLGYANALGISSAIGILLAVGLALSATGARARAAGLVPIIVLAPTLYYTSSRGSYVALAVGFAFMVARRASARTLRRALAAIAVAAVALAITATASHLPLSSLAGQNRSYYWHAALDDYVQHPVLGSGAGTYGDYWLRHRRILPFTRTAHSLYLQSLAELGPLGFALLAVALGAPLVALRRGGSPVADTAAAAYAAYLLHTGIDWDWELPAVTLLGLACGLVLVIAGREETATEITPRTRALLLAALLPLIAFGLARLVTGPTTPFGY
jgi:O-antigen ligase